MHFDYEIEFREQKGYLGRPTYGWELTGRIKYVRTLTEAGKVYDTLYLEATRELEFTVPRFTFFGLPVKPMVRKRSETRWFHEKQLELKPVPNVTIYDCNGRET